MKKVKFEDALEISWNLHKVFEDVHKQNNTQISKHHMNALIILNEYYGGEVSLKRVREDTIRKHPSLNENKLEVKISKIIKVLLDNNLIIRTRDETDKRIKIIKISESGLKILKKIRNLAKKAWEEKYND